jgi:lipopolysaccharide export system protein LptC
MRDLAARIRLADGPASLTAVAGTYDYDAETVNVTGPVEFAAADGYRITMSNVSIDLARRLAIGTGGVSGAIPAGTFSANRIVADLGERSIALEGNARLRMAPGQLRMP